MTELQRYLAEEVAEDHADGIITRREAVRRLGLLGLSGAAASALLAPFATSRAAASDGGRGTPRRRRARRRGRRSRARRSPSPARDGTLMAAWAPAAKPRGGVLVIHENRGLTDHIRTVAGRFAASG